MSSTDKTKFKITETSKQANVDITSDKVELAADTSDHILVATVPSNANVTDVVNVEVEMSPDGENWCPALRKETISTPGSTTPGVIGNEKFVDLTVNTTSYKAHAKGELSFDTNGNEVGYQTGTRDFMDQHIAVNKSFNHSMWIKSDTLPTSTYKPVLFRHGGYDDFENTKTVQLDNITEIISETKYAKFPSDSELVYEADFPISDFEGTDWLIGLTKAGDPSHSGSFINTEQVFIEIGDFTAGDYIQGDFRDSSALYRVYVGNTAQYIASYQGTQLRGLFSSTSHYSQSYTTWIHHPARDPNNPSPYIDYRFRKWTSDSDLSDVVAKGGSFLGNYTAAITSSTSTKIRIRVPANANSTKILQNLVIYQLNDTSLDADSKARSLTMRNVQAPASQGHTLLAAYNFGDISGTSISNAAGSGTMTKTYSGSDTLEYSNLALSGPNIRRPAFYAENSGYLGTATKAGFNPNTTSGFPDITNGFSLLFDCVWQNDNTASTIYRAYVNQYSYFLLQRDYSQNRFFIWFHDRYGTITGIGSGSVNRTINTITGIGRSEELVMVVPPKGPTDNLFQNTKVYTLPDSSLDLTTATVSDMSIGTDSTGMATWVNATSFTSSATLTLNAGYNRSGQGGGSSTVALFNGTLSDQEALNLIIACRAPNLKNLDTEISNLSNATLSSCYGKDITSLTSPTTTYVDQNESNDGTFASSEQVVDLFNQGQANKTTQNLCEANTLPFSSIFTTTSNLSISGWFKTTDTGTLFSNTGGAATSGLKLDVNASDMTINFIATSAENITVNSDVNDGEWHHLVITKNDAGTNQFTVYVDGVQVVQDTATIADTDLKGSNGFTLLGDGQNNANAASPGATDNSKLQATLSNWSLHSEVLDEYAVKQLYSNGHVRNIKNLPSVTPANIEAWWQLNDQTNPEQDTNDIVNGFDLQYQDADSNTLVSQQIDADEDTLIQDTINGNAMTLSITKNFDFVNEVWVSDASGDAAFCLSLNGFEEQAEYFALWKCSQTLPDGLVDVCDGNWHNIILSYRGQNDLAGDNVAEGDAVRFGNGSDSYAFNFSLAIDGYPLYTEIANDTGADYIGGNNALLTDVINSVTYNVGFNIYNRHLKYETSNTEEEYKVHAQFGAGIHNYLVSETDPNAFRGSVDETSFHSDPWWVNSDGSNIGLSGTFPSKRGNIFNQEKVYTMYGRTTALDTRGLNKTPYAQGIPYPLLNPELLITSENISDIVGTNQFINPIRKGDTQPWNSQVSTGGVEGWWRWGDTAQDCSLTINDVKSDIDVNDLRDIQAVELTDQGGVGVSNVIDASNESIYVQSQAGTSTSGSAGIQYNQIKLQDLSTLIGTATCAVKDFVSPVLKYLRIKLTGAGTCDIGEGKLEIEVNHKKRRMK